MENNLVLVVHGVGEQAQGETLDALVGGVVAELPVLEKVHSRSVQVASPQVEDAQLALFPTQIRETIIKAGATPKIKQDQHVTAAEVYWSDLSPAPNGALATVVDLFRVVLGLGYLALDNIENNGFRHPAIALSVRMFVWVFYTLIAPMNVVLLLGSFALLIDPYLGKITDGRFLVMDKPAAQIHYCLVIATLGGLIFGSAIFWFRFSKDKSVSYLARNFMKGYAFLGFLILLSSLFLWFAPAHMLTSSFAAPQIASSSVNIAPEHEVIAAFVSLCIFTLGVFWLMGILILLVMTLMSAWVAVIAMVKKSFSYSKLADKPMKIAVAMKHSARSGIGDKRLIYLAICTAMLLLWLLFSTAFWAAFAKLVSRWNTGGEPILLSKTFELFLGQATSTFSYTLLAFSLVATAAILVALLRSLHKKRLSQAKHPVWQDVWLGRLLLNPVLNILLVIGMGLIVIGTLYVVTITNNGDELVLKSKVFGTLFDGVISLLSGWESVHIVVTNAFSLGLPAAAFAGLIMYNFSGFFAAALGVGRDIVVYSTRSHAANPRLSKHSTYLHRSVIEDRFSAVLAHMTRNQTYDRVIVVAHSQGTVIAARGMAQVRALATTYEPILVTMGSPLSHIYAHYFSDGFNVGNMVEEKTWVNIYRRDDFVGTGVTRKGPPILNHAVTAKGHTGYWTDRNVLRHLKELI